jgi:hypothetical protein
VNDSEREQWINNDEAMYWDWKRTRLPIRKYVRSHRAYIDMVINAKLQRPPHEWPPRPQPIKRLTALPASSYGWRNHKAPEGSCATCDEMRRERNDFHPSHDASAACHSGRRSHCSCDECF